MRELPAFLVDRPGVGPEATAVPGRPRTTTREDGRHVPGEAGLWLFLFADMTIFVVFFATFLVARGQEPAAFAAAEAHLSVGVGLVNTLVLLATSLAVALTVRAFRDGDLRRARRLLGVTLAGGGVFVVLKSGEWIALLGDGHDPGSAPFFMYYFAITGVHLFHVVVGIALLSVVLRRTRPATPAHPGTPARRPGRLLVESSASYWHMVDLLWLLIFPLASFASGR